MERRETGQGPERKSLKKRDTRGNRPPKHHRPHKQKGRSRKQKVENTTDWSKGERIAKYLARCGVASRRACEALIEEGKISVDGVRITTPAFKVTGRELIKNGRTIVCRPEPTRLWRYHKPAGLLTTNSDPEGRSTIFQELPKSLPRTITIGRLDYNTEGLLLLTNDGGLARALELPSNSFARTYRARAHGRITQEKLDMLKEGVVVDGETFGEITATLERQTGANSWIIVSLKEGKKREVRRALEHLELQVNRLIRISYGPFELRDLKPGQVSEISSDILYEELGHLLGEKPGFEPEGRSDKITPHKRRPNQKTGQSKS